MCMSTMLLTRCVCLMVTRCCSRCVLAVCTPCAPAGHASALGALIHLLRSPSKPLRQQGYAFLQAHYHLRPKGSIQVKGKKGAKWLGDVEPERRLCARVHAHVVTQEQPCFMLQQKVWFEMYVVTAAFARLPLLCMYLCHTT